MPQNSTTKYEKGKVSNYLGKNGVWITCHQFAQKLKLYIPHIFTKNVFQIHEKAKHRNKKGIKY